MITPHLYFYIYAFVMARSAGYRWIGSSCALADSFSSLLLGFAICFIFAHVAGGTILFSIDFPLFVYFHSTATTPRFPFLIHCSHMNCTMLGPPLQFLHPGINPFASRARAVSSYFL